MSDLYARIAEVIDAVKLDEQTRDTDEYVGAMIAALKADRESARERAQGGDRAYLVTVNYQTGDVSAVQVDAEEADLLGVIPGAQIAVENQGTDPEQVAGAAISAICSALPEIE